jgi:hypothetical protein
LRRRANSPGRCRVVAYAWNRSNTILPDLADPAVILPTVVAIVLVATTACLWPASCPARYDPAVVLRED